MKQKIYSVALLFEKLIDINKTNQQLFIDIVYAYSSDEALGKVYNKMKEKFGNYLLSLSVCLEIKNDFLDGLVEVNSDSDFKNDKIM